MRELLELEFTDLLGDEITVVPELGLYEAEDVLTNKTRYNIAVQLYEKNECGLEPYGVITVNLGEFVSVKNATYIDTNNNSSSIVDWLVKNDFGQKTEFTKRSGYCEYPLFIFDEEMLKKIDYNGIYKEYESLYNEYRDLFDPNEK